MKVLELFAGTSSVGKAFQARGHQVFTVDWDERFPVSLHADISKLSAADILARFGRPDVIWASPDCATYSIAAISRHRRKGPSGELEAVSDYAKFCDACDQHVLRLILALSTRVWFIENPRGGMRTMPWMEGLPRYTVTYCQYGDRRMKPTDIWTSHPDPRFLPPCRNGDPCHEPSPRGAAGGTTRLRGPDRGRIPPRLCEHIVEICEELIPPEEAAP